MRTPSGASCYYHNNTRYWLLIFFIFVVMITGCGLGGGGGGQVTPEQPPQPPYNVEGVAKLQNQANHSAITIKALKLPALQEIDSTQTDSAGNYYLWLPIGDYKIQASKTNYHTQEKQITITLDTEIIKVPEMILPPSKKATEIFIK